MKPATPPISIAANFLCDTVSTCKQHRPIYTYRLARLGAEERCEFVRVLVVQLDQLSEQLLPLLNRSVPPRREGLLCSSDGIVQVLLAGDWHVPELLACGRVDAAVDLVGATLLAIDHVVELLKVEGGNFAWRHDCGCGM